MNPEKEKSYSAEDFRFRDLHPNIFMGTASDRYAGWLGQIYDPARYAGQLNQRAKRIGGKRFSEIVLPVDSVKSYFEHFRTLELDFSFYAPLLTQDGEPTRVFRLLKEYRRYLKSEDRLTLKVPQIVSAKKVRRRGHFVANKDYLNARVFTAQFYEPLIKLMDPWLDGMIFEQEYQRKGERESPFHFAEGLNRFFASVHSDSRYHVELRTEAFLTDPVFRVLEKHGVGQVLSHWTWLPGLLRQFNLSGGRFLNRGKACILRLMTPRGMRYEAAYAKAHPFDRLINGMCDEKMVADTVVLMKTAAEMGVNVFVNINNRAGGNAPLIAAKIAHRFTSPPSPSSS